MNIYEGNRAHEAGFAMMTHISPDYFIEAVRGNCQIQSESYIFYYGLELTIRSPVTQISHR